MCSSNMRRLLYLASLACLLIGLCGQVPMTGGGKGTPAGPSCTFSTISFTGSSLGAASLARASSATYINSSGVLTTATTNAARFNFDANYPRGNAAPSLTGPFLLVEPAATNLLLQSNAFSTTWFAGNGNVVTAAQFTSPDGTNDGWSSTAGTGFGTRAQQITFTNVQQTGSVWAKNITGSTPFLINISPSVVSPNITLSASIERFSFTGTPAAGSAQFQLELNTATTSNVVGNFGAQLETGSVATSYIVTTTTTATRSADVVTFPAGAGCGHYTFTFDDNSMQTVTSSICSAGTCTVPAVTRPNLKSIDGST